MKAMILAAGRGERMRPLTDKTPKPLLKVGGKPLIVWHLERLAKAGFKEVVINHAHLGHMIEAALGNGAQWGVSIQYSPEKVALETAGGIASALHLLTENGKNVELFLLVNGDTFTEIDFASLAHPSTPSPLMVEGWGEGEVVQNLAHLVLVDNPPQHPNGDFAIEDGMLKNDGKQMLTFSGVAVYHPALFADIVKGQPAKLAPLLRKAIDNNAATAQYYQGIWHDIGTPERLKKLDESLLKMALPKSIFDQVKEMDKLKESLLGNSYLKTLKQFQVSEIDKMKQNILDNPTLKFIEQFKSQELQRQKLLKDSFAMPNSALQAINAINASNKIYADSLKSLFRPLKLSDSIFESAASKLFKELSKSPLREFNNLAYPANLMDIMVGKNIQDFEKRYKNSLNIFPSEISSALAISKMLGPVGVHAHYEEILKELKRQDDEPSSDDKRELFSRELLFQILAVLMFLYQEYSSSQMEQRLNNKIDAKAQEVTAQSSKEHNELKEHINQLELLIVNLSQTQQKPFTSAEYVVKDRSALIREVPKNGSKVIAHIFPNQVVTIIDSEGKWIEVTYYDWAKRNYMNGWVLKKYLQSTKSK